MDISGYDIGNSSGRAAHLLRRPYENVVAAGIRPIAKRFSMAGCVTVQGLSELLRMQLISVRESKNEAEKKKRGMWSCIGD